MKEIIITSQRELDALPIDFDGRIIIKFGTPFNRAVVNRRFRFSVVARGNSSVEARGNSSVEARENSSVVAWGNSSVVAWGNCQVCDSTYGHDITVSGNARIVYTPKTIEEYMEFYGIEHDENHAKLFKAVRKRDGRFFSDHLGRYGYTEYIIGSEAVADGLDEDPEENCGHGIHMAYKEWCVDYGRDWKDLAIVADISKIIVPVGNPGKVRTYSVKVLREVPLEECGLLGKMIAKKINK